MSFAKLDGPLEPILVLYARGDVERFWPAVERFGLARSGRDPIKQVVFASFAAILEGKRMTAYWEPHSMPRVAPPRKVALCYC